MIRTGLNTDKEPLTHKFIPVVNDEKVKKKNAYKKNI